MNIEINAFLLLFISCMLLSCAEGPVDLADSDSPTSRTKVVEVPVTLGDLEQDGFRPDFSIVTGVHRTGEEVHRSFELNRFRISRWSSEVLLNPDFPMSGKREVFHVVVLSLFEMGFSEDDLVSLADVLEKVREMGLLPLTPEQAVSAREQFIAQPDYTTGERLGEFFVAMEPMNFFLDGMLKIFSIQRDDAFPHPDTNVGLWLVSNNVEGVDGPRLFNPLDPEGADLGGRFACIVPPDLNLDILELRMKDQG